MFYIEKNENCDTSTKTNSIYPDNYQQHWIERERKAAKKLIKKIEFYIDSDLSDIVVAYRKAYKFPSMASASRDLVKLGIRYINEDLKSKGKGDLFEISKKYGEQVSEQRQKEVEKLLKNEKKSLINNMFKEVTR